MKENRNESESKGNLSGEGKFEINKEAILKRYQKLIDISIKEMWDEEKYREVGNTQKIVRIIIKNIV